MADSAAKLWQMPEFQEQFCHILELAIAQGPQFISKDGEPVAVLLSIDEFARLSGGDFKDHLRSAPDFAVLELSRSREIQPPIRGFAG